MIIAAFFSALIGVWALSIVVVGHYKKRVNYLWQTVLAAGALALMINDVMLNIVGLVFVALFTATNTSLFKRKEKDMVSREAP
jgi:TRAP-type uncharacterized transport system fused permease subunit